MDTKTFWDEVRKIDIGQIGAVARLDAALRAFKKDGIEIGDIGRQCGDSPRLARALIGLWAFDFIKGPRSENEQLVGYNNYRFSDSEVSEIARGLVEVIRSCRVAVDIDLHAIDYHYAACGRLYWLCGTEAEGLLVDALEKTPNSALVQSIGVLVCHQYQGFLKRSTVDALIRIAKNDISGMGVQAKEVLVEDVVRMNKISHFYGADIDFSS